MKPNKRVFDIVAYFTIIILAILFLYIGNSIALKDFVNLNTRYGKIPTAEVKVTQILSVNPNYNYTTFEAEVIKGLDNEKVIALQHKLYDGTKEVEVGDKVIVSKNWDYKWGLVDYTAPFEFVSYQRIDKILYFAGAFVVFLLFFCRLKGLNALFSLGLTCASIAVIFMPSLLSGKNIYLSAMVVCAYSIVFTILIVNGINKKSFAAIAGCFGGVISAVVLTLIMSETLRLTGVLNNNSRLLEIIYQSKPIDLKAVIFAGIIIGAVGAIIDTSMSIASSLWELTTKAPDLTFSSVFKSGVNIGQDLLGTMADTLVLAYVGNSLSFILIHIVYSKSFAEFINKEIVIVELLSIITGSFGILLTMPFTALICAVLFTSKPVSHAKAVEETGSDVGIE